jgi:hypothetical protein
VQSSTFVRRRNNDESLGVYCNDSRRLMINPPMRISKLRRCWRRRLPCSRRLRIIPVGVSDDEIVEILRAIMASLAFKGIPLPELPYHVNFVLQYATQTTVSTRGIEASAQSSRPDAIARQVGWTSPFRPRSSTPQKTELRTGLPSEPTRWAALERSA